MTSSQQSKAFWDVEQEGNAPAPIYQSSINSGQPVNPSSTQAVKPQSTKTKKKFLTSTKRDVQKQPEIARKRKEIFAVALVLLLGNAALVIAANTHEPWPTVEAFVLGGPIDSKYVFADASVDEDTLHYQDVQRNSYRECRTVYDSNGEPERDFNDNEKQECETRTETTYVCHADLYLTWTVNGTNYTGWQTTPNLDSGYQCKDAIEEIYAQGTIFTILVDPSDPEKFRMFEFGVLTSPDPEHQGYVTGYSQTLSYESTQFFQGGYELVSVCKIQPAVKYTFDGQNHTARMTQSEGKASDWGAFGPVAEGSGEPCIQSFIESYSPGTMVRVSVDPENPARAEWNDPNFDPGDIAGIVICCSLIFFIIAFIAIANSKGPILSPKSVSELSY